jgi:hypothetical protein
MTSVAAGLRVGKKGRESQLTIHAGQRDGVISELEVLPISPVLL